MPLLDILRFPGRRRLTTQPRDLSASLALAQGAGAEEVVPSWRGVLHAYAFWLALAAAASLVALAPGAHARLASVIYGTALCALFAISGLYHRWRWSPRWRPLLRRLDHSTIFLFIAASTTPIALLVLTGGLRTAVLVTAWVGALAGIAMSAAWIDAPRGLVALSYVAVGCAAGAGLPQIVARVPLTPLLLLGLGGVLYVLGAVVYATRRPDPWPRSFGFHEIFHGLVVAAAACHFVAMVAWIVPGATAP
jgi:hemolysin III